MRFEPWALLLALASGIAAAQLVPDDPDWKEIEAPRPPALRTTGLVGLDVPGSSLRFGVDPDSVTLGADGVVRYVLVGQNVDGVVNGMYEGIRCSSADVKVYARHDPDKGWVPMRDSEWTALRQGRHASTSLQVARQGACAGNAPNGSPRQIVLDLRSPANRRFDSAP
jgi:hypothetical protein